MKEYSNLWVGALDDYFVIYDPAQQNQRQELADTVILWDTKSHKYSSYISIMVKKNLKEVDPLVRNEIIRIYFSKDDTEPLPALSDDDKRTCILNHKNRLKNLDVNYGGISPPDPSVQRRTICYACYSSVRAGSGWTKRRRKLDASTHFSCRNCGWIICVCGGCGCGKLEKSKKSM